MGFSQRLYLGPKLFSVNFNNIQNTFLPENLSTAVSIKTQKIRAKNKIKQKLQRFPS